MAEADRLRKREYIRRFMQQYRGKQRKAKDMLRSQVESLEGHVAMMMEQTKQQNEEESTALLLPWKEVATAVNELQQESVAERRRLTNQIREYKQVIEEMKTWVAASSSFVSQPNSCRDNWRNFSLLAHPTSRRLGKQWIIQHMYHNLDQAFQHYGLPAANTAPPLLDEVLHYKSMEIHFTDEGRHSFVQKLHKCWNAPLEVVVALFRGQTGSMFTMDAFHPIDSQVFMRSSPGIFFLSTFRRLSKTMKILLYTNTAQRFCSVANFEMKIALYWSSSRSKRMNQYRILRSIVDGGVWSGLNCGRFHPK
ncbi:hypothetical protein AC1031_011933 [Aphanomyces cochlioides]|nr:hypothetical protein AC1031_011933 [Aphanomyces cochlioides]